MTGLDTNVLLRYLIRDDAKQTAQAARLIDSFSENNPGFVSTVVLIETVWNLLSNFEFTREELILALDRLLSLNAIVFQHESEVGAAFSILSNGTGTFPDALIAALGSSAGCQTTYTFDRKAARLAGFTLVL
jgi:predicted nucleic-acid-binding protein